MYADDITIISQDQKIELAEIRINNYLKEVEPYLAKKQLILSTTKCKNMLFTDWSKERKRQPNIKIGEETIETV